MLRGALLPGHAAWRCLRSEAAAHRFDNGPIPCGIFHRLSAVEKAGWAAYRLAEWEDGDELTREPYGPPPNKRLGRS